MRQKATRGRRQSGAIVEYTAAIAGAQSAEQSALTAFLEEYFGK
jgi:hypothetical protein